MSLPVGPAVTFLFTDIEGSTRLERAVGAAAWAAVVARHDELLRDAIEAAGGVVVKTEGDAFFAAFADPLDGIRGAAAGQRAIAGEPWPETARIRVRMGLHAGEGRLRDRRAATDPEDYVGIDVNYAARIAAAGNGSQVVVSGAVAAVLPPLDAVEGLEGAELRLDGLRAVKDFDEPLPLYRLVIAGVADDARPLRTLDSPSNLPGDVTTFVGRSAEVAALGRELGDSRIVTLTGPGGSGKTRLALATARSVRDRFPHGTWFVDLASVQDPALLEPAIAGTLGVRESADQAEDEALRRHRRERTTLLVLDNLEQLLPAVAERIARLAREAPELRVLATSREVLRVSGEHQHRVPPLGVEAGVELFLDRARAHRADLVLGDDAMTAVRAIAERLDGLPLGIELAAARIRLMGPTQILERLGHVLDLGGGARDLPERQRTLRGAIAWSHDLLTDAERRLFARLAVFASGWTAASAFAVADPDGDLGVDVLDGLESLVDKSLIQVRTGPDESEPRFGFHPLLREFALERLAESGERDLVEERFALLAVALASSVPSGLMGSIDEAGLARLDVEDRNLRAAVEWALATGRADLGLRIVAPIWRWYLQRGRMREARGLIAAFLDREEPVDVRVHIAALEAAAGLAYWLDDFAAARSEYEQRLALADASEDDRLLAGAHYDLGFIAMVEGRGEAVRAHEQQATELYLRVGDEDGVVRARQALVLSMFLTREYAEAARLERANLEIFRARGSMDQVADSLTFLSACLWKAGDLPGGWAYLRESMRLFRERDSAPGVARAVCMAAIIALSEGEVELGGRLTGSAYRLVREKGVMLAPVRVLHLPDPDALLSGLVGAERAAELRAEGDAMPLDEVAALVEESGPPGLAGRS
jgi:predicted ATPase/class 3 adenylate cyclase